MAFQDLPSECINIVTGSTTAYDIKYQTDHVISVSKSEKKIDFETVYIVSASFVGSSYPMIFNFTDESARNTWYSTLSS